jgi:putative transposase
MPQAVTIRSLPGAFELVKAMQVQGLEWGESYRSLGREAIAAILQSQMAQAIERFLSSASVDRTWRCRAGGAAHPPVRADWRCACLCTPSRTDRPDDPVVLCPRAFSAQEPALAKAGVGAALLPILGRPISPATVSRVVKQLDAVVTAFHARPLRAQYRVLMLDGVVLARRTGAGAIRRPVLVPLGLRHDGKKEVIDFRLAQSESAAEWERFLGELIRRGLIADQLEMIGVDGGSGLLAALPTAYPGVPVQRCWAHKIRNVLAKVRVADQPAVKADLHAIMNAKTLPHARSAARRFADRWATDYPKAVACLRDDLDELLTGWRYKSLALRKAVRTTNAIERRFREVRRRTRPMGVFSDRTSMDRILFAVFNHENQNQGVSTPLLLTQTF